MSQSNDLFDEPLASSTSIARAVDDDADDDQDATELPSDDDGDGVATELPRDEEDDEEEPDPESDPEPDPEPDPSPSPSPGPGLGPSPGSATSRGGSEMTLDPVTIKALSSIEPTVAAYAERMGLDFGSAEGRAELQRTKRLAGVARPTAPQSVTVHRRPSDKNSFGVKRARRNNSHPTRYFGGVSYAPYTGAGEARMTCMSDANVRDNLWRLGV